LVEGGLFVWSRLKQFGQAIDLVRQDAVSRFNDPLADISAKLGFLTPPVCRPFPHRKDEPLQVIRFQGPSSAVSKSERGFERRCGRDALVLGEYGATLAKSLGLD